MRRSFFVNVLNEIRKHGEYNHKKGSTQVFCFSYAKITGRQSLKNADSNLQSDG